MVTPWGEFLPIGDEVDGVGNKDATQAAKMVMFA
jgi:hypothetical protein